MSQGINPILTFTRPTIHDERDGKHLLVWGNLAAWMVMDDELYSLLGRIDGATSLGKAVAEHAARWGKPAELMVEEAEPILQSLLERQILAGEGQTLERVEEPVEISNVTINPTNRCNLACPFCYNELRSGQEISSDSIVSFLKEGREILSKDSSLIILGGEPTLDPDRLFAIIDGTRDVFSNAPMISTNGTFLDEGLVGELSGRDVEVQVSLDGHNAAQHDRMRGDGVFDLATAGIRRLVAGGVNTILSMVYTSENIHHMEAYLEMASNWGVAEARFIPLRNAGAAGDFGQQDRPDQLAAFENVMDILERRPEFRPLLKRDFFSIAAIQCRYSSSRVSCGIGRRVVFIDADGSVYPCPNHATPDMAMGRVDTTSLAHIFTKTALASGLRDRYHVDRYTRCRTCAFKGWCAGDCRGEVVSLTGDPTAPSPHCGELRKLYLRLLWMIADGDSRLAALPERLGGKWAKDIFM